MIGRGGEPRGVPAPSGRSRRSVRLSLLIVALQGIGAQTGSRRAIQRQNQATGTVA
jgi:hypothetical protein